MKRLFIPLVIFFFLFSCAFLFSGSQNYTFSSYLPKIEKSDNSLTIKVHTLQTEKEFYIYYRSKGLKKYQVRKMQVDKEGSVYYRLSTENLYGRELEYRIVTQKQGLEISDSMSPVYTLTELTGKESPEIYFQDPAVDGGSSSGPKDPLFFRFEASLNTTTRLHDSADPPEGEKFDATGDLRVFKNIYKEKFEMEFDSQFTYMNNVTEDEEKFNMTSMKVSFKKGAHKVEAGDLNIYGNHEFSASSISQRGLFYELDGKTLYLNSYFTNSQQKKGFDGFGFPPSQAYIFGATAGFNLGNILKVRGNFISGKDSVDSKTMVSAIDSYSEGTVYSIFAESYLFQNKLTLKGEYAHSDFGRAEDKDHLAKEADDAYRGEMEFSHGIFSASGNYKKVGENFGTIANVMLENDIEDMEGNATLSTDAFRLALDYTDRKTFVSVAEEKRRTKEIKGTLSWTIANHIQVGAEASLNNLDYDETSGLHAGGEAMDTRRYAGSLGYIWGSNNEIKLTLGKTEAKEFESLLDGEVYVNLVFGRFLTFSPGATYKSTENYIDSSTTKDYSISLQSELSFIPELFRFSVMGSWEKTDNENDSAQDSTNLSVTGTLTLDLAKLFKDKLRPSVSLQGVYRDVKNEFVDETVYAIHLMANIAF